MECIFSNIFRGGDFLRILTVLSDLMVPLLIFYVVGFGFLMKQDVFGDFLARKIGRASRRERVYVLV